MFAIKAAFCLLPLLQATLAPAQLITLRDGKVGVNFAGFHADAGLGGLLTGNSAHGGLSASAGTPWGSRAAAGLGGNLNGRTAGGAYAAAQATDDVGASALLGGTVGDRGYIGAESHVPGKVYSTSKQNTRQYVTDTPVYREELPAVLPTAASHVQRVKPPKKYSLIAPNSDHTAASGINENHVKAATIETTSVHGLSQQEPMPLIIVKRPRLRVKRPRQRQRKVYVTQLVEQQQGHEVEQEQELSDQSAKEVPKSAKVVHTRKVAHVATSAGAPQGPTRHVISTQNSVVNSALDIPIGILRSLQVSLGNLGKQPIEGQLQG